MSPPLAWSNVPDGATNFVLIAHDVDAAVGQGTDDMLHWMVWNIPGCGALARRSDSRKATNCPTGRGRSARAVRTIAVPARRPSGPAHHYVFEIYALDAPIDVPAVGQSPPLTRAAVEAAMVGKIRARGTLVGLFKR